MKTDQSKLPVAQSLKIDPSKVAAIAGAAAVMAGIPIYLKYGQMGTRRVLRLAKKRILAMVGKKAA